ncbi:ead/Ea22-like family protein [Klebsiella pneumoniae]|uniref:ead/Ea22-like family protein n=1 Tax=Klebsiella pneumoniae TaxID=573 RepID=UPI003B5AFCE4
MTDITELAQRMKAAAEKATHGQWLVTDQDCRWNIDDESGRAIAIAQQRTPIRDDYKQAERTANAEFIALANPANILALVEALEKAQQYAKERDEENQDLMLTIGRLRVEREGLEAIRAAAEKLVRCKGRYHSEHNYRALAALFGVKTPDLPPLDSESSAVTVKLTDINEFLAEVHDKTLNRAFRLLAEGVRAGDVAAMRAAGIKVETE